MRKALLYTIDYPPMRGGVARYLSGIAAYFGSDMDVVGPDRAKRRWWQVAEDLFARRASYEVVVVSHLLPVGTGAMVAGYLTRRPYVVIVHGMDVGLAKRGRLRRAVATAVLRRAKLVVTNSRALEAEVRRDFGLGRTLVAYPTVGSAVVSSRPPSFDADGRFRLLTVARLVARKGHLRVIAAMEELRRRRPDLTIEYLVVGDGPIRAAMEARGSENVRVVTNADDAAVAEAYASADLFVMPVVRDDADREGFGLAYIEAAVHGVPSVATDMPGVDEAVLDGVTGILVPDGDIAALADALAALADDRERRFRMGEAARARALSAFTPEAQYAPLRAAL
jgi:glycosyltransferase involved in cell wall biosynthesis